MEFTGCVPTVMSAGVNDNNIHKLRFLGRDVTLEQCFSKLAVPPPFGRWTN